jgi:hypothetical protein
MADQKYSINWRNNFIINRISNVNKT